MDLVAVTRELTVSDVEAAYRKGIFPMHDPDSGLFTWHRPPKRAILPLAEFHISRSLAHTLKRAQFTCTYDTDFAGIMDACSDRETTWISDDFKRVYGELHRSGKAHSVEIRVDGQLAGGTYGVHLGGAFFAESKFHRVRDMSKVALAKLVERLTGRGFVLLEVQYLTRHLSQFGVREITNREYQVMLQAALRLNRTF